MVKKIDIFEESTNYKENINVLLNSEFCSPRLKVEFALHCATNLEQYYDVNKYPEVYKTRQKCLKLVGDWLLDSSKVTNEQLKEAAFAANAAAYAANAAFTAYYAAIAAALAAYAAAYAAANAANAAADLKNDKYKELYKWLFNKLTKNLNTNVINILYRDNV